MSTNPEVIEAYLGRPSRRHHEWHDQRLGENGSTSSSTSGTPVLEFRDVNTHYGAVHILKDVNIAIYAGEMVCLLGGNASGKTTTLKTILGMVTPTTGKVVLDGEVVNDKPTAYRVEHGVTMVPENRRLFKRMTVKENLEIGAYLRDDKDGIAEDSSGSTRCSPGSRSASSQKAGTLSGGEQQMVAMGRALMARPKVLLMDEPSMGLAPVLVQTNFEIIQQINAEGVASSWSSRTPTWRSRSPTVARCCRPARSSSTTPQKRSSRTRPCGRPISATDAR